MGAALEKLVIPWGAVLANVKTREPPIDGAGCRLMEPCDSRLVYLFQYLPATMEEKPPRRAPINRPLLK